jgi:cytochrome c biogenesis protein CcmG, thiol:disulfide interchange protein DsbE
MSRSRSRPKERRTLTHDELIRVEDDLADIRPARRRRWVRWSVAGLAVVVILGGGIVAGRGLTRNPTLVDSPLIDKPAPAFRLPGLDGQDVASGDFAGRLYVVNFWASWCVPCRAEAAHLQSFWERYGPEGVALVGVVYQDDEDAAREFRDEFGLTFPQVMDPGGRTALDFGVFGIPETFVVDEQGVVKAKLIGAVGPDTLDRVLSQVAAGETYTSRNDDYRTSARDR